VVVFVDGATLDVLLPLARQSRLPFFGELFEAGASARLATAAPVEPLAANTTLATGKLPYRHGLLAGDLLSSPWLPPGELRLTPLGFDGLALAGGTGRRRAARAADRQARAVWEIVAAAGAKTALLGFPAALEDEPALDAVASAELFTGAEGGEARPAALDGRVALLTGAGGELPAALAAIGGTLAPVVRDAFRADAARAALAESLLAEGERFDQLYLSLPGLLAVELATRGGLEADEHEGARGRGERAAADALTAYAATLDSALARLWQRMRAPRALAVVSAFGVDRQQGLARRLEGTTAGAPDGAFWLLGDGVARSGASLPAARIVDVAPTLLYVTGLPIARDFDGRVLTEALEPALLQRQPLAFVPTWGRNERR
jgi:predicted AlkP superfamily phosphohydrolase/phosphomutase